MDAVLDVHDLDECWQRGREILHLIVDHYLPERFRILSVSPLQIRNEENGIIYCNGETGNFEVMQNFSIENVDWVKEGF